MEALFYFLKSRNIKHYDVQCELADHIANAIEQTWKEHPAMPFGDALALEEEKFGGKFGFMKIMFKRQAALRKRYRKMFWGYFFTYFKLPQIIGVAAFGYGLFRLMLIWHRVFLVVLVALIIAVIVRKRQLNKAYNNSPSGHHWLMEEMVYAREDLGYTVMCFNLAWQVWRDDYPFGFIVAESVIITLFVLYGYVKLIVIPNRAEAYLKEIYPEYGK